MLAKSLQAAAGNAAEANYIEDVFSTYLYSGVGGGGSSISVPNGIDLTGKGGLVWIKQRNATGNHYLYDTVRGGNKYISSNTTSAQTTFNAVTFGSSGFTDGFGWDSSQTVASWTFRKQPKFFDVVTYTGDGTNNRAISHNLGSAPGCIIVKETSGVRNWFVYHQSSGTGKYIFLNTTGATVTNADAFPSVTSTTFTPVNTAASLSMNVNGETYVAYLFAHDAGGFGLTGTDNVISCGSFTTDGSGNGAVTLGYEPQWIMYKRSNDTSDWQMFDNMRGLTVAGQNDAMLLANTSGAETSTSIIYPTATGFGVVGEYTSSTWIYIAIRRGPMKVPTTGTSVFSPYAVTVAANASVTTNFPIDMVYGLIRGGGDHDIVDRLRGISNTSASSPYLKTDSTSAELSNNIIYNADNQTGYKFGSYYGGASSVFYSFRRAPGFFDEVCWYGDPATVTHNLTVVPELVIQKNRTTAQAWAVWRPGINYGFLNTTAAFTSYTGGSATSTTFTPLQTGSGTSNYVSYLFATCPGVSKVGSYTGTAATQTINCGFTAGARFVLIKRTDDTGDWYVWDSARGIVAGDDPYLLLNSTAAEVTNTDYVDTAATGFEITSTAPAAINASGGTFIFLAIA
jgi:hypothetical protein